MTQRPDAAAPATPSAPAAAGTPADGRVLVLAPRGRNAELIAGMLARAGVATLTCADAAELCRELGEPTGGVVLCEEALTRYDLDCLVETLGQQPPWSEVPLLLLTGGGRTTRGSFEITQTLGPRGNFTLLERPVRVITLVSAVRAGLRARRRQYEVRDLLAREQEARARAEAASRAKDHFLATLSHELRTPLNPVLMTVTALAENPTLPPDLREDVDLVRRNVELESKLIDDLLDLTRIVRGKLELHYEVVDMHALLDHAVRTCDDETVDRKGLTLTADLAAESHTVWGDSARLSQVFWNLIKNAVKFTPAGGSITIRTQNLGGQLLVTVTDTGIGIEPEAAGRIFDAFEQESRTITRAYGGLGLGLAISKALVGLHGGAISVVSGGKGHGATFAVRLTTIPAAGRGEPARVATNGSGGSDGERRHLRILLVEDHEATAQVMAKLLRGAGYDVALATSVREAKQRVDGAAFDLLVSDIGLPDGTGLDVVRHLRATRQIPAIAVSGYGMADDLRLSYEAGFDEHLVKPIDLPKLQAAIRRVMGAPKV